ncbi:MAG TPA: hypothetical protein VK747_23105, partial [Blastocatellia bacterium]|nr:hypothetical protein [Blastocatellia bacterium]
MNPRSASFDRGRLARALICVLLICAIASPPGAFARPALSGLPCLISQDPSPRRQARPKSAAPSRSSAADAAFLEDLSRRAFSYFWEKTDPDTGLVLDRARTDGSVHDEAHSNIASLAATGFGLTGLCIASEHGWVTRDEARKRALASLRFFAERAPHEHGWFYHWMDWKTGARQWNSEVSSIDTALFLAGVLTVKQCFRENAEIVRLATRIYRRVDFRWMLNGHPTLLSHGWKPETGFLKSRWDTYSEHTILNLLAIGSPTRPTPPAAWR